MIWDNVNFRLVEKAPDFWSWRGGVFWFKRESVSLELASANVSRHISKTIPQEPGGLPLEEILRLIEQIEAQEKEAPLLATLYESLAEAYEQRYHSQQERQLAIKAYQKAIALQTKLGLKADLASSLQKLGNLYFELHNEVKGANDCYQQALLIYQEIGDRQGEADTLQAIGDVLQFLNRLDEALQLYETALSFYRDIGDRLGEANILQEFGKLQENPQQALEYLQQAQNLYIQIGDIYSQSRNLLFIADVQLNMGDSKAAINSLTHAAELATTINYVPFQEYAQTRITEINSTATPTPTGE